MNPDYMTDEVYSRRLLAVDSDAVLLPLRSVRAERPALRFNPCHTSPPNQKRYPKVACIVNLVEISGIEPLTACMACKRSPS